MAPRQGRDEVGLGEFLLLYDDLRAPADPEEAILAFVQNTYEAGARLQGSPLEELELRDERLSSRATRPRSSPSSSPPRRPIREETDRAHALDTGRHRRWGPMSGQGLDRPREGRMLAGVCAGIARHYGWNVTVVRAAFVLFGIFGAGEIVYLALWIIMPKASR